MSNEFKSLVASLVSKYGGAYAGIYQQTIDWLVGALNIAQSEGGPNTAFIGLCNGLDADLRDEFARGLVWGSGFLRKNQWSWSIHTETQEGIYWDLQSGQFGGTASAAIRTDALARSLPS